tara:strand:+ start:11208 stop:11660 length:453 start_codon:yes stop_codon:yes gene_type:complete
MPKTIARDSPLNELTLRRYEKPYTKNKREIIRKFCLSIGLLQPGDSRDIVVDVFQVMLNAKNKKLLMNSEEIKDEAVALRKKAKLPLKGIASSNIRRQLKRLRDLFIVEKLKNEYRITEFEDISVIFDEKVEKYVLDNIMKRVKEYSKLL